MSKSANPDANANSNNNNIIVTIATIIIMIVILNLITIVKDNGMITNVNTFPSPKAGCVSQPPSK